MRRSATVLAAVCLVSAEMAAAQVAPDVQKYETSIGVSGNAGPDDRFNPLTVVYKKWQGRAATVLGFINERHPRDAKEIEAAMGIPRADLDVMLADLETCGLVRRSEAGYAVTFVIFDDALWKAFEPAMGQVADALAATITAKMIPAIKRKYAGTNLEKEGIPFGIVAALLVGAFGLDEAAIDELQQREMIRVSNKPQPGGRQYVVLARSNRSTIRHRLWGIHSVAWGDVKYATFGDNSAMNQRRAEMTSLPDVEWVWRATGKKSPQESERLILALGTIMEKFGNRAFSADEVKSTLPADDAPALVEEWTHAGLLAQPDATHYRVNAVVFSKLEVERFRAEIDMAAAAALQSMKAAYPALEASYAKTPPALQGIPLAEALDTVYHTAYSLAFEKAIAAGAEMAFKENRGSLKYTGYAVVP